MTAAVKDAICALYNESMLPRPEFCPSPIVYSGPNRNVVYSEFDFNFDPISLFDAPEEWDDLRLDLQVFEDPGFQNTYEFYNMLEVHGNMVKFVAGAEFFDIKRLAAGDVIDGTLTFHGNSYRDFSNYFEDLGEFPSVFENGEFRNATGYAGIKLTKGSDVHYGWIQVSVTNYNNANITGTLIDWAYNSLPGEPILAGQTE